LCALPDEETLGGEGVGLHVHVRARHVVHEGTLAHVWEACHKERAFIGVDARQSRHVLPHLLQESQTRFQLLGHGGHSSHGCLFQHFAPIQTVGVLHQSDVVFGDVVYQRSGAVQVSQRQLVMILVIQHIDQSRVKRVDVIRLREVLKDV